MWHDHFEAIDGLFVWNTYWETLGPLVTYFRAYNPDNYYKIVVDPTEAAEKRLRLWKNNNGQMNLMGIHVNLRRVSLHLLKLKVVHFLPRTQWT